MTPLKSKFKLSFQILLKVIANPVTNYLPAGGVKIGLSVNGRLVNSVKQITEEIAAEQKDVTGKLFIPPTVRRLQRSFC